MVDHEDFTSVIQALYPDEKENSDDTGPGSGPQKRKKFSLGSTPLAGKLTRRKLNFDMSSDMRVLKELPILQDYDENDILNTEQTSPEKIRLAAPSNILSSKISVNQNIIKQVDQAVIQSDSGEIQSATRPLYVDDHDYGSESEMAKVRENVRADMALVSEWNRKKG